MARYTVSELPVESLTPEQVRGEAEDLRHQMTCVSCDIASKRAWTDADGKLESPDHKIWTAKARFFWGKLCKRYSEIRRVERKLNRKELTSSRHVRRDEFDKLIKHVTEIKA
jgi:hypothetical protein